MNLLLQTKKELSSQGYEAVTDDVVAQIYIDEKAVQLFLWADTEDRAAKFNKYVLVDYLSQHFWIDHNLECKCKKT